MHLHRFGSLSALWPSTLCCALGLRGSFSPGIGGASRAHGRRRDPSLALLVSPVSYSTWGGQLFSVLCMSTLPCRRRSGPCRCPCCYALLSSLGRCWPFWLKSLRVLGRPGETVRSVWSFCPRHKICKSAAVSMRRCSCHAQVSSRTWVTGKPQHIWFLRRSRTPGACSQRLLWAWTMPLFEAPGKDSQHRRCRDATTKDIPAGLGCVISDDCAFRKRGGAVREVDSFSVLAVAAGRRTPARLVRRD